MIELKEIDFGEFEKDVYLYYVELFAEEERQPLLLLKKLFEEGTLKFVKIMDEEKNVGFLIYVTTLNNPYVWLDYFAIYKEFQNKQYGTEAIKIFKTFFKEYDGIYGEIETLGYGETEEENKIREKRLSFWKNLGFELLNIDMNLFEVVYSACVLKLNDVKRENTEIVEYGFQLYEAIMGKEVVEKRCFVIEN